jgi:hypothetical protein
VLTHDRDFGTLAIHAGEPYFGIVYLRPGHISAEFTWRTIAAIESTVESVEPPFIVVAERRGDITPGPLRTEHDRPAPWPKRFAFTGLPPIQRGSLIAIPTPPPIPPTRNGLDVQVAIQRGQVADFTWPLRVET